MSDDIDLAQSHEEMHRAHALAALERQRERQTGLPECRDCGEDISVLRQALGATLCIDCQTATEARAAQMVCRGRM